MTIVSAVPAQAFSMPPFSTTPFSVSRLDADPVPAQVITGEFDARFVTADDPHFIDESAREPRWWRLTANEMLPTTGSPHLLLHAPYLTRVEVWVPGQVMPIRRSLMGRDADPRFSTRALVVPLADGLLAGEQVYLRVTSPIPAAMRIAVEPLAEIQRHDLAYVALRTAVLTTLLVLAVLAFGFWVGMREHNYAFLMLLMLAQAGYLASVGGEMRVIPWLADVFGNDPRTGRLFAFLSLIASVLFVARYLELAERQPRLMRLLDACNIVAVVLILLVVFNVDRLVSLTGNLLILVTIGAMLLAAMVGLRQGQRPALLLLLSWVPLFVLMLLRAGEWFGFWSNPGWVNEIYPVSFAIAGLVITVGLGDKLHQLRSDRDRVSRMVSYDALTGATSRTVIDEHLKNAVADAHRLDRPLSVVFFDIDRFKQINDVHGHRVGDQCLKIIALRTRNRLRTYDQMGRYGGDEMIVILPDTELIEAVGVAENLRSAVNCRPLSIDGKLLEATLSLGVAELMPDESPERLLERADAALYASKEAGRDRVSSRTTGTHRAMPKRDVSDPVT